MQIAKTIDALCAGEDLGRDDARALFERVMAGEVPETQLAGLLIALKAKGETPDEIAGAAEAMRAAALPFDVGGREVVDTCGTGGDGAATVNVSTAAAIVAAELGMAVVKHGNRSVSSRSGSADVLEQVGVRVDAPPEVSRRCLDEVGICFLYAPQYHSGVRHAMPARRALGVRTMFNLLGPLANPAAPRYQLMGVYDPALCAPLAETLGLLGCAGAMVVNGAGLDEVAVHGPTTAALWGRRQVREVELTVENLGLGQFPLEALRGGGPEENAAWLQGLLAGEGAPAHVAAVAANAGALLWLTGGAICLDAACKRAQAAIESGACLTRLERWKELSHGAG